MTALVLTAEWERIHLLGECLSRARRGEPIPEGIQSRLQETQGRVQQVREQTPWQELIQERALSTTDQDILACALAPVAEPRLGWMFQEFQPGLSSAYPTPALIQELYFMDEEDARDLHARLVSGAPLLKGGLVEAGGGDVYAPIRPTRKAHRALLGWPAAAVDTPPFAMNITEPGAWEDLVLPAHCLRALREFLLWMTHRAKVVHEWGGKAVGGPVALFAGPSGTGKTFSATILANAIGWPLFRVDLGMLVSKYIGETEKNLNAVFEAAHGQPIVLLFDEAESLFGKRGEVKEARDRFANMEVSHLLSRIERHQGPCLLTSNLRKHLDPAFARRFQVVVEFPRPDAAARAELWKRHLPPRAPRDPGVDPAFLGEAVALTGGQIRNAALHAAFLAAESAQPLSLPHIASSVWTELTKEGQEIHLSSLGPLASHFPWRDME